MLLPGTFIGVLDGKVLEALSQIGSAIALWVTQRKTLDPLQDLTERVRHPVRWTLRHPVQAVARSLADTREEFYPAAFRDWADRMRGPWETLSAEERAALYECWIICGDDD